MKHDVLLRALRQAETRPPVSRRRFIRTGLGTVAVGAVVGRQLLRPQAIYAAGSDPIPVPGSPKLAPFHVWAPAALNGAAALTITLRLTSQQRADVRAHVTADEPTGRLVAVAA